MHVGYHAATAAAFLIAGDPVAAIGCVLPDAAWAGNEIALRRSCCEPMDFIATLTARQLVPYRIAHSWLTVAALIVAHLLGLPFSDHLAAGWMVHLICDLPTHDGVMRQRPLYPFGWEWPHVYGCPAQRRTR